ncbi:hypothetical protein EGW08_012467, partial [Elysia chlorotica]
VVGEFAAFVAGYLIILGLYPVGSCKLGLYRVGFSKLGFYLVGSSKLGLDRAGYSKLELIGINDLYFGNAVRNYTAAILGENHIGGTPLNPVPNVLAFGLQVGMTFFVCFNMLCTSRVNTALGVMNAAVLIFVFIAGIVFGDSQNFVNAHGGGMFSFGAHGVFQAAFLTLFAISEFDLTAMSAEFQTSNLPIGRPQLYHLLQFTPISLARPGLDDPGQKEAINPAKSMPRAMGITLGVVSILHVGTCTGMLFLSPYWLLDPKTDEAINPAKSMPRAMGITLGVVSILHVGTCTGMLFLSPYWLLDLRSPLPLALGHQGLAWAKLMVTLTTMVGLSNLQMVTIYGISRCIYRMSKDGLLFSFFLVVDKKSGVPLRAVLFTGITSALLGTFFNLTFLIKLNVVFKIVSYIAVASALIRLKITQAGRVESHLSQPPLASLDTETGKEYHDTHIERDIQLHKEVNSNSLLEEVGSKRNSNQPNVERSLLLLRGKQLKHQEPNKHDVFKINGITTESQVYQCMDCDTVCEKGRQSMPNGDNHHSRITQICEHKPVCMHHSQHHYNSGCDQVYEQNPPDQVFEKTPPFTLTPPDQVSGENPPCKTVFTPLNQVCEQHTPHMSTPPDCEQNPPCMPTPLNQVCEQHTPHMPTPPNCERNPPCMPTPPNKVCKQHTPPMTTPSNGEQNPPCMPTPPDCERNPPCMPTPPDCERNPPCMPTPPDCKQNPPCMPTPPGCEQNPPCISIPPDCKQNPPCISTPSNGERNPPCISTPPNCERNPPCLPTPPDCERNPPCMLTPPDCQQNPPCMPTPPDCEQNPPCMPTPPDCEQNPPCILTPPNQLIDHHPPSPPLKSTPDDQSAGPCPCPNMNTATLASRLAVHLSTLVLGRVSCNVLILLHLLACVLLAVLIVQNFWDGLTNAHPGLLVAMVILTCAVLIFSVCLWPLCVVHGDQAKEIFQVGIQWTDW